MVAEPAPARLALLPPAPLAGVVHYFHIEQDSPGAVLVPATPFPMLTFFIRGGSRIVTAGGERLFDQPFVAGPVSAPFPAVWEPGTTFISAMIRPGRFGLLFDAPLAALRNSVVPLTELAPRVSTSAVQERLRATGSALHWTAAVSDWMLPLMARRAGRPLPFALPAGALALDTTGLARELGLSVRQLERRYLDSYGETLRDSRKMARYVHALSQLMRRPLRHGMLTRLAMDCGYHDQAHMTRDFVQYTGLSPRALLDRAGEERGALRLLRYEASSRDIVTRDVASVQD